MKRIIISLIVSAVLMSVPQYLTANYIGGNDGIGALLLLFALVYPVLSVVLGIVSGKDFKKFILIPILNGIFFLISAFIFIAFDLTFVVVAAVYVGIGIAVAAIASNVRKKKVEK